MSTLFYPLASLFQYFVVRADFATKVTKRECKKKIKFKYIVDRNGFCRFAGLKIKNTYMSVIIKEAVSKKEMKQFIHFGIDLYKGNPYFCPPLLFDERNTLDRKKNPAFEVCESIYFLAYKDNKIVGRVAGIVNHRANEVWKVKKVRFGWIDFIDDMEVSTALFKAVEAWGKSKGMEVMNGPVGFTDFDHTGLLLEGYDKVSSMAVLYNYPYYVEHFEKFGFVKEADWLEWRIKTPDVVPERMARIAALVTEKYNLKVVKVKSNKELVKRFGYSYFDLIDTAYQPLYNYSPLTDRQKRYYADMFFPMLNFDFVSLIVNEKDELVGVGGGMPDITKALQKNQGRLFPFGFIPLLKTLKSKKIDVIDLLLIAVRPDYQNKGVNALIFAEQIPLYQKYQVKFTETSYVLETNLKSYSNYIYFEKEQHKRRRAYVRPISI